MTGLLGEVANEALQRDARNLEENPDGASWQVLAYDGFADLKRGRFDAVLVILRTCGQSVLTMRLAFPNRRGSEATGRRLRIPPADGRPSSTPFRLILNDSYIQIRTCALPQRFPGASPTPPVVHDLPVTEGHAKWTRCGPNCPVISSRQSEHALEFRDPEITSVLDVATEGEMAQHLVHFAVNLGFTTASAVLIVDQPGEGFHGHSVDNIPAGYLSTYQDPAVGKADPVSQHCKRKTTPIIWNQSTYTAIGEGDKWDLMNKYGLSSGVALALHLPTGRHLMVAIDTDATAAAKGSDLTHIVSRLHLYSLYLEQAAEKILLPKLLLDSDATTVARPMLTHRELECLKWVSGGKSAEVIGQLLSVSESAVIKFLASARIKLNCSTTPMAIVKAMKLGLLS